MKYCAASAAASSSILINVFISLEIFTLTEPDVPDCLQRRNGEGDEGDDGALKAIREFTYILRWINELTHHHMP